MNEKSLTIQHLKLQLARDGSDLSDYTQRPGVNVDHGPTQPGSQVVAADQSQARHDGRLLPNEVLNRGGRRQPVRLIGKLHLEQGDLGHNFVDKTEFQAHVLVDLAAPASTVL